MRDIVCMHCAGSREKKGNGHQRQNFIITQKKNKRYEGTAI